MKIPIEKASAVRSGGSSIASRRRNAARNIGKDFGLWVFGFCALYLALNFEMLSTKH
jgi:hypothetical protein